MSKSAKNNRVRIIAGDWRGRRLPVADVPGLRPSGDRSRETLFNWLQPWVVGADCADLFAGTGALGFEAASRGAASVLMVEKHPRAFAVLTESAEQQGVTVLLTTDLYNVVRRVLTGKLSVTYKESLIERIFKGKGLVRLV